MTQTRTYNISITITVDDEDADLLARLDRMYISGQMVKQATRQTINSVGSGGYVGMHRAVLARQGLAYGKGMVADHIDNNPGNNRRSNLRVVTSRQNRLTATSRATKQSLYNGVKWQRNKWVAQYHYQHNGKIQSVYLGIHVNEIDAAKAYDTYIRANNIVKPLNFPEVQHEDHRQAS